MKNISNQRRSMPRDKWPARDRECWQAALTPGDLLEPGGCRAEHSLFSNLAVERGYGTWLAWLDSTGLLDRVAPSERITSDRVHAFVSNLEERNASGTIMERLIELRVMAGIIDPVRDWSWIYRVISSIRVRHTPARPKRHRLVPVQRLLKLGLDLMANAANETLMTRQFRTYRDGLMIALLASRPLRLRNLTRLVLNRTLVRRGDLWWIDIPAAETKTRMAIELVWPDVLVPHLDNYLATHRSRIGTLAASRACAALWVSRSGVPLSNHAVYLRVVARTREGLGQPVNPHLFRDCVATSIAIDDPAHIAIASRLLGHRFGSMTERYYNQASSVEAAQLTQNSLLARRKGLLGARDLAATSRDAVD